MTCNVRLTAEEFKFYGVRCEACEADALEDAKTPEERYPSWPPPRRPALTFAKTFIPLAQRLGGVTVAAVTEATGCPFREAVIFLGGLQSAGRVLRFGGEPGKPLVWCLPRIER